MENTQTKIDSSFTERHGVETTDSTKIKSGPEAALSKLPRKRRKRLAGW